MTKSLEKMTNEELALSYSNGNNNAFDFLLERVKGDIFSYILVVVRNKELAEDIFQDTFIKIIMKLQEGRYSDNGKFLSWAIRIAHNAILDLFRKQKSQNIFDPNYGDDMSRFSQSVFDHPKEQFIVNKQVLKDAKNLMMQLPESQREVVYMRCFQDISFKEIAEITGVSINTALGRMRYGIINMRKLAKLHNVTLDV
ncbi:MAG: sigma-70 family RNA polymerase sigma factor [Prevotella sp.]|nr:sigma-70 family RNA polymerase sigma factor [Prevotella sp.]MCF0209139.1 sigma-70 family RNA polymerase sigma factor [Bacteroidaceae bacterium]